MALVALIALVSALHLFTVFSVNQLIASGLRYQTAGGSRIEFSSVEGITGSFVAVAM